MMETRSKIVDEDGNVTPQKYNEEYKPDSRWKVFCATTKEFLAGYLPTLFGISLTLSLGVGLYRQGLSVQAIFDGIMFTAIFVLGMLMLCVGFALHVAIIYRKDGSYNKER